MPIGKDSDYKRFTANGPGGWKCGCCNPQSSKARGIVTKLYQKRYRAYLKKLVDNELKNTD